MTAADLRALAAETLRDPRSAAQVILAQPLRRDVLWTALALVAVLNSLIVTLALALSPSDLPLPAYVSSPLTMFVLIAGLMVVYVHALFWAGLAIGGKGTLDGVLALMVWLQILRSIAQLGILLLSLAVPGLSFLVSLVVTGWSLWALLHFVCAALNLPSMGHGFIVLVLSAVGMVLGLAVLLSLIGLSAQGVLN